MIVKDYMACKITVPEAKRSVLTRRDIVEIINKASLDEIVYFVAPYGSGKTMAVLSWLIEHEKKAAWVTLDDSEDSPVSLWAHISAAILLFAGEQKKADNILNDAHFLENPRLFLRETLVQVASSINERILIIDGFRHIQNGGLLREIKDLVSNMLGCWRIIIMGRTELPQIFNDFLLKKHLRIVTLTDLNFSLDEINQYSCMNGFSISKKELTQIYEDTDGWPAALNAILTVTHTGAIRFNDTARAYVTSYFETKIWQHLSEQYKEFLLRTSILDRLTPSICHFVAGVADAVNTLRNLYAMGLFISKLEERDSYCYHRLFREFLLEKLNNSDIDINGLYVNAGWWLYEKNESIPALLCFFRAKFIEGVNIAFKKVKPAYMGMDEYVKTTYCLTSLDIMELKQHPEVAARIALLHFLTDNIAEMQRIYKIIREWLEPGVLSIRQEDYRDFYWEVGWLRYVNPDEDIIFDDEFSRWVNVMEYAPHLLENDRARASALRLPSVLRGVRDFSVNIDKTLTFYKTNNATQDFIRDEADLLITDIVFAEICYEREDYEQAEKTITRIIPIIEREKYTELYFSCIVLLVKITRAVHNRKEIDELTERVKAQIIKNGHLFLFPNYNAFVLQNRLASGVPGMTEEFDRDNRPYRDQSYYFLIYRHFTMVRALISEEKYNEASLMLINLDYLLRQYKRNMDLIESKILRSVIEYGLGHKDDAVQHLKLALNDGQKNGFIRIFADDAALIWPIINLIFKRDLNEYISKVKISCKLTLERSGALIHLDKTEYDPLNDKEIQILKMLHLGMMYKEIAISTETKENTVKWHISKIYSKLHAKNKTSAIIMAMKLGLI